MIIYGLNPVMEAIRSEPERIRYIGISREHGSKLQKVMAEAKKAGVSVRQLPADQVDRLAGRGIHNGVVAEVSAGGYADFDDVVDSEATSFVLILDGITDPQNLGAILRVADGFGVDLVVLPEHESVGLTPVAVKASAGASQWVPVAQVTNVSRAIGSPWRMTVSISFHASTLASGSARRRRRFALFPGSIVPRSFSRKDA